MPHIHTCLRRARLSLALLTALGTTALGVAFTTKWASAGLPVQAEFIGAEHCRTFQFMAMLRVAVALPPSLWLLAKATSPHLEWVAEYMTWGWAGHACWWTQITAECGGYAIGGEDLSMAHALLVIVLFIGYGFLTLRVMLERLLAMQSQSQQDLHAPAAVWVVAASCLLLVAILAALQFGPSLPGFAWASPWLSLISYGLMLLGISILLAGLCKALRLADEASRGRPAGSAKLVSTVRAQVIGSCMGATTTFLVLSSSHFMTVQFWSGEHVLYPEDGDFDWSWASSEVTGCLDVVANTFLGLALSGALSGAMQGSAARFRASRARRQRWRASTQKWQTDLKTTDDSGEWVGKVVELAHRGVTLRALLKFYGELGLPDCMPGFDPESSTTKHVVMQAIIPRSRKQRSSYSEVLMEGKPLRAECMVTHNWSNLFRDLVAAIAADALGEAEFSRVTALLATDLPLLESWVEASGAGSRVYWICAFSVNQHLGICGSACDCGLPKALNDTPPTLGDGRSIACEMNKFADMVKYLSASNPSFRQVVAVDCGFQLFGRAWCVAEIAAAHQCGMEQHLKIWSPEALAHHRDRLGSLRVQDMKASRPEDVKYILASIDDVDDFNRSLRALLLEDLLPAWNSLDGEEQMAAAGKMIRWHKAGVPSSPLPTVRGEPSDCSSPRGGLKAAAEAPRGDGQLAALMAAAHGKSPLVPLKAAECGNEPPAAPGEQGAARIKMSL